MKIQLIYNKLERDRRIFDSKFFKVLTKHFALNKVFNKVGLKDQTSSKLWSFLFPIYLECAQLFSKNLVNVKELESITLERVKLITRPSLTTARTEATFAANYGTYSLALYSGVKKMWINDQTNEHSRHGSLFKEIREANELFSNDLLYPGDTNGLISQTINCRCFIVPVK